MPTDSVYLPVHVGAEGKASIGYTSDNTGDNISSKKTHFCELADLCWDWKILKLIIKFQEIKFLVEVE